MLRAIILMAIPLFAWQTQPGQDGRVTGTIVDATGGILPGANVRLVSPQGRWDERVVLADRNGTFSFGAVPPATYLLANELGGFRERFKVLRLSSGDMIDVGFLELEIGSVSPTAGPVRVVTVCEALARLDSLYQKPVLMVGAWSLAASCPGSIKVATNASAPMDSFGPTRSYWARTRPERRSRRSASATNSGK